MKRTLLQLLIISALYLGARTLPPNQLRLNGKTKINESFNRTQNIKPILDSVRLYEWNDDLNRYDDKLYIVTRWSSLNVPITWNTYLLNNSRRIMVQKFETTEIPNDSLMVYSSLVYNWDTLNHIWVDDEKRIDRFTKDGRNYIFEHFIKNRAGEWYQSGRNDFKYDAQGNTISQLIYGHFVDGMKLSALHEWTYNPQGEQTSYTYSDYVQDKWVIKGKEIHTFDTQGRAMNDSTFRTSNGVLKLESQKEYLYDNLERLTMIKSYFGQLGTSPQLSGQDSYFYDETQKDKFVVLTQDIGDSLGYKITRNTFLDSIQVDSKGRKELSILYEWDRIKNEWYLYEKTNYSYFKGGQPSITVSSWDKSIEDWKKWHSEIYYYRTDISAILDQSWTSPIALYPNPTKSFVKIGSLEPVLYKLYNSNGEFVKEGLGDTIDIEELPNGIYMFHLQLKDKHITQKIIKNQ